MSTNTPKHQATVELDGKPYTLTSAIPVLREREAYIVSLRPDPTKLLQCKDLPQATIDSIIRECMKPQVVTFDEDTLFEQSVHGICYRLWHALQSHHASDFKDVDAVFSLVMRDGMDKLESLNAKLNEVDIPASPTVKDSQEKPADVSMANAA